MKPKPIPQKLKQDAIIEAIFEIRFDPVPVPEVLFGRLADHPPWKTFTQQRMPLYDLPASMRQADANLRYQPVFELRDTQTQRLVRVGPQVLSYHQLAPYVGWSEFKPNLHDAIDQLFAKSDQVNITRLGLRYLNALRPDLHNVRGMRDIDTEIVVSGDRISENVNLNYTTSFDASQCTVRIATTDFVSGSYPPRTSVFIDVDVYTKEGFRAVDGAAVKEWLDSAHNQTKKSFFGLLSEATIEALREE